MSSPTLANPRRTSLAGLAKGSELATCQAHDCANVAVRVLPVDGVRTMVCRAHVAR